MKKSLSLLLAIALVFTMLAPASLAAETEMDAQAKFEVLEAKDIFEGHADGTAGLDENMTRAQAAVVIAKLFGLDYENAPSTVTFSDVPATHWAHPYVEVSAAAGIIAGQPNGSYADKANVTTQELAAFLVRGYANKYGLEIDNNAAVAGASAWAQAEVAAAIELGLIEAKADYTQGAKRAELVVATYSTNEAIEVADAIAALVIESVEVVDATNISVTFSNEEVLAYELDPALEANVATEVTITHEASGKEFTHVVTYVPSELLVGSVKVDSLKEVTVNFNATLDKASAETKGNYAVKGQTVDSVSLNDDGKSVTITLAGQLAQQANVDVTVEKVKSEAGVAVDKTTTNVTVFDVTVPTVVGAEQTGPDSFKVTFSEHVQTVASSNIEVNDGQYFIKNVSTSGKTAIVDLYTTIPTGNVEVSVSGVLDLQGYKIVDSNVSFASEKDEVKPAFATVKKATPEQVVIEFTEDISLVTDPANLANFYHTNSGNTASDVSVSGKELTIDFAVNKLPSGTAYLTVDKEVVKDGWNNQNVKIEQTIEVTVDTSKPEVKSVQADGDKKLVVEFTEVVTGAATAGNYTVLDSSGEEVDDSFAAAYASKKATLDFGANALPGSVYTVVVENVKDVAGNEIDKVSVNVTVTDATAPTVTTDGKLYKSSKIIKIEFSEAMNADDITDLSNYLSGAAYLSADSDYSVSITDNGKAVLIDYSGTNATYDGGDTITVGKVTDVAGNSTANFTNPVTLVDKDASGIGIASVQATAKKTIVVKLDDALTSFKASDFVLETVSNNVYTSSVTFENVSGKGVITYTLVDALDTTAKLSGEDVTVTTIADPASANSFGVNVAESITPKIAAADKIAAEIDTLAFNAGGDVITVTFTENVESDTLSRYTFSVSGNTVTGTSGVTVNSIDLELKDAVAANAEVTVTQELDIVGADGNTASGLSKKVKND